MTLHMPFIEDAPDDALLAALAVLHRANAEIILHKGVSYGDATLTQFSVVWHGGDRNVAVVTISMDPISKTFELDWYAVSAALLALHEGRAHSLVTEPLWRTMQELGQIARGDRITLTGDCFAYIA